MKINKFETDIAYFEIVKDRSSIKKSYKNDYKYLVEKNKQVLEKLKNIESEEIIKLIDFSTNESYLICEYYDSVSLVEVLTSYNTIEFIDIFSILESIAIGIDFLHLNNIIHSDIRIFNILVDRNLVIKINDFDYVKDSAINEKLKFIDIHSYVSLVYRIIQLSHEWNAIKHLNITYNMNNLDYSSCKLFLKSMRLKEK